MQLVENYYLMAFLISLALTCIYTFVWHKHFSVFFSLIFAFIPIVNLGYYLSVTSTHVEGVMTGIKITYIGGCFLLMFITIFIFNMCHIKISEWFERGFIVIAMLLYITVLTIGKNALFYESIYITIEDGIAVNHKVYGPFHTVMYLMIILYFLLSFGAMIYALFVKKEASKRIITLLFIPEVVCVICFFGSKIFLKNVELTPVGYIFAQIMFLFIAHYLCLYDISDVAVDSLAESGMMGFLSFDKKLHYLGATEEALKVFPGLRKLSIDRRLKKNKETSEVLTPWIEAFKKDNNQNKFYYKKDDNIYLVEIHHLLHAGTKRGFQISISDDTRNQKYIELLGNYNTNLEREVKQKTKDIIRMHNNFIRSMATMVENRDNSTGGHIVRTSDVVEILMGEIVKDEDFVAENNITETFVANIIKAAPLHDIGKISVPDSILKKPKEMGRFTEEEFKIMKGHSAAGAEVLQIILEDGDDDVFKKLAINVAHYHHERMDGSGYPKGLKGDEIPLEARIMAVADVYDALVSKRIYKDSMSFEEADKIMMESMGRHFDKRLEKFYVAARPKIEEYYSKQKD